jgi:hypothetical protein
MGVSELQVSSSIFGSRPVETLLRDIAYSCSFQTAASHRQMHWTFNNKIDRRIEKYKEGEKETKFL